MKNKIITYSFLIIIFTLFLLNFIIKDEFLSYEERRKLEQLPKFNIADIMSGEQIKQFEKYTLDQFPYRNNFRTLKAYTQKHIFNKLDNNNLYNIKGNLFKMEYPTNKKSISEFIKKINKINDIYLKNNNVYYSVIPDKNYYSNDSSLKIDYNYIFNETKKLNMKYINIKDNLDINDFYRTDTHWRQENIVDISNKLLEEMNNQIKKSNYQRNEFHPFYGVYYGQSALKVKPDKLIYLTNDIIENVTVKHYEENKGIKVYDINKFKKMDAYDIFLSGASSLIEIENKNCSNNKELIIFRDSFGSSIAPLLIESYSKITLIDLRYISINSIEKLVSFNNQDVLFLYSTLIINNSGSLKV